MSIIQSIEDSNATKRWRRGEFSVLVFLSQEVHHFLLLDIRAPGSWAFRLGLIPQVLRSYASDWELHHWLPLDQIIPPAFLALQLTEGRMWEFSASITAWTNSYNNSLLIYISIYPTGSVFWENPDEYNEGYSFRVISKNWHNKWASSVVPLRFMDCRVGRVFWSKLIHLFSSSRESLKSTIFHGA